MDHTEYLKTIGAEGGKARAKRTTKAQRVLWGKKGGRPRKEGVRPSQVNIGAKRGG